MLQTTREGPRTFDGMAVPPGTTIKEWDSWPVEAKKLLLRTSKAYTIGHITDVRAFLHQVQFTGRYRINKIREKLGPVKPEPNDNDEFFYKYVRNVMGKRWSIYVAPQELRPFNCLFRTQYPSPKDLRAILACLPNLQVRTVEYTLDIMCSIPSNVSGIFRLLKRYLWLPGCQDKNLKRVGIVNQSLYVGQVLLYERGRDEDRNYKRKHMHWRPGQLDRVRLEFSPTADQLRHKGLRSIGDLLDNPRFSAMLSGYGGLIYQFAKFKDQTQDAPHEWEEYQPCPEPNANLGQCFQEQYFDLAGRNAEPHKKVKRAEGFEDLIDLIHVAIQGFSVRWQRGLDRLA